MTDEPDDDEIEAIHEKAAADAIHAWGPAGINGYRNPYPAGSERAEIYAYAFRNSYARENGY